jgi:hypothetical protein
MSAAYGYDIAPNSSDVYVRLAKSALESLEIAATPGSFYVDIFPIRMCYIASSTLAVNIQKLCSDVYSGVDDAQLGI